MNSSTHEQRRKETNLKAKMARSLVSDLLLESGNDIYPLGFDSAVPRSFAIEDAVERNKRLAEKLRLIPDFLVLDTKGHPHVVDVRFRWSPEGHVTDAKKLSKIAQSWEETMIIFVNCSEKPYFRLSHAPYLNKKGSIITVPLENFENFGISRAHIAEFEELVLKYLSPTLFPKRN